MQNKIFSGYWGRCHCQGIAVDQKRGYIYYSFTTKLVKSRLDGTVIGTVDHIIGHLGCIALCPEDGRLYASLEYKNDAIGRGIRGAIGAAEETVQNGFYIAIFDVDRIDRPDMDAERDGVMRAVYLRTVVEDYEGTALQNGTPLPHVHGCSGIDGLTFGPDFGSRAPDRLLHVCYGIYSDTARSDNDYQVILQYDTADWWERTAAPLSQASLHKSGPAAPRRKYFLYTGNTCYGIQNFEYDPHTGDYIACVYKGRKPQFPNYPMFVIDGSAPPREEQLRGYPPGERGLVLTLRQTGVEQGGISGVEFPFGSTGFYAIGDGRYYVSHPHATEERESATTVCMYRLDRSDGTWRFLPVE